MGYIRKSPLRTITIYGLLVAGSAIFSLPFLWMVATSVKVDRELFTERLHILPMAPRPAQQSPYFDPRRFRDLSGPSMETSIATLRDEVSNGKSDAPESEILSLDGAADAASRGIYERLVRTWPKSQWEGANLTERLRSEATPQAIAKATLESLRWLGIGSLHLIGEDGREVEPLADRPSLAQWDIEAGAPHAVFAKPPDPGFPGAMLRYELGTGQRMVLHQDLGKAIGPDAFAGIRLSIFPDDSWHRLTLHVKAGDRWYRAKRPFYLAATSSAATDVTWQLPSKADTSNQIKSWILLEALDTPPSSLVPMATGTTRDGVSAYLVIDRSSVLQAWWGKLARNYLLTFTVLPFWRYFATSLFVTGLNIAFTALTCSLVAFSFSRINWAGRDTLFAILLATMMIPAQVTMIPQFMIFKALGWYNTLTPLWIGALLGNAFYVFLMRQFMKSIPRDLEDAARIDGCGFWGIYWRIVLPLVRPALATIAIFTFLASWNDFMTPLIYLNDERLYTLSMGLFSFRVQLGGSDQALLMAACFMMLLPMIVLFFGAQRYFIQGVTITGMK